MTSHLELFDKIEQVFSAELGNAMPSDVFRERKLVVSDDGKRVTEFTSNSGALAEAVLGVDFPREAGPVLLEHYAPLHALKAIAASSQILLRPVSNYLHQDEFKTFAIDHHLDGYLAVDDNCRAVFEDLTDNLFFLSLTKPGNQNELDLWKGFANEGKGACLQLSLTPEPACDVRAMSYQHSKTAFRRINDELAKIGMTYIPWTLSRICAFYLPQTYSYEEEIRLLIKRHEGGINNAISDVRSEAWPVQIGVSGSPVLDPWCGIELVGIRSGPRCTPDAVRAAIKGTTFEDTPIT
ncbi:MULTISPECIES: hypothetical protein [unclassified Rhizobium]|uniref:hypothetical protein n=1 Tax=unclassified Rhizobium TaxID=2613769 RepID=UPI00082894F5|nr:MULTISPECIES: hypothetical protein [unclassified Rhizobium]OCJ08620.1 hypothetical protein A6U86_27275 [Rhizobium sp. AC27/96]TIX93466.1 hypothetical protein BSK43_000750 [Rhizobium sp. P44RR-XXIV]